LNDKTNISDATLLQKYLICNFISVLSSLLDGGTRLEQKRCRFVGQLKHDTNLYAISCRKYTDFNPGKCGMFGSVTRLFHTAESGNNGELFD